MTIYGISGLGADERVFDHLTLEHELIPVEWIAPRSRESIVDYSKRLIEKHKIGSKTEFGVLGVSFGGLIATEISKLTKPSLTILISSVETRDELPTLIRLVGKIKITDLIPKQLFSPPRTIAHFLFGTNEKKLLNSILDDTDLYFAKWAIGELTRWENQTRLPNLIKIGGVNDKLLPPKGDDTILITEGEHFMIVDKAGEISEIVNDRIKTHYNTGL